MFFEQYWLYFLTGLTVYVTARITYWFINSDKKNRTTESELGDPNNITNEVLDKNDDQEEYQEDEYSPALPEDLKHIPLVFERFSLQESRRRSAEFYNLMNKRRTVRHFSKENVPIEVIQNIIKAAGTAPSGAHTEPWTYIVVKSLDMKQNIRNIIEDEEEINYRKRMGKTWTTDLKPLKTNWIKEYLTDAPYLILVFKQLYSFREDGKKKLHYYNEQSVSIGAGILLTAIHYAGLVSLTSTPLNCGPALRTLLNRPSSEKLVLLLPVGYPAENCTVPDLKRKPLEEIMIEV